MLGEFLVNSVLATVLFDSGASHSFISAKFVAKHGFHMVPLRKPLITRSPGADIKCQWGCPQVKILLSGVEFLANLVVLQSVEIDVILEMDWLAQNNGTIACATREVTLENHKAVKVRLSPRGPRVSPMLCNLKELTKHDVWCVPCFLGVDVVDAVSSKALLRPSLLSTGLVTPTSGSRGCTSCWQCGGSTGSISRVSGLRTV